MIIDYLYTNSLPTQILQKLRDLKLSINNVLYPYIQTKLKMYL